MSIIYEDRLSDSPYVETITRGRTAGDGSTIRPAACHWHMVFVRLTGRVQPLVVGPLTTAGVVSWTEGAEVLGSSLNWAPLCPVCLPGTSRMSRRSCRERRVNPSG
jgi:hypothetical protein